MAAYSLLLLFSASSEIHHSASANSLAFFHSPQLYASRRNKGLHESCDGLEIVAKVYSVSRCIGMCFSQLGDLLYHEASPKLVFVSQ